MAKEKGKAGLPNRHLHARISYLKQAATLLASSDARQRTREHFPQRHTVIDQRDLESKDETETSRENVSTGTAVKQSKSESEPEGKDETPAEAQIPGFGSLPLLLTSQMAQVARKSQIRLHSDIKHTVCKRCSTPLIEGQTCTKSIENLSKGGRKPHADVLILTCTACAAQKRWPIGAKRQQRKTHRNNVISEKATAKADAKGKPAESRSPLRYP